MLYVLAYPEFSSTIAAAIDRFRAQHEPERARRVKPHVTLVFGLRNTSAGDLLALCQQVARNTPAIGLSFDRSQIAYDPFEDTTKLFLMCDDGKDALISIHKRLYKGPQASELDTEIPYAPHMTIATNKDRARIEALDLSDLGAFRLRAEIRSLEVVRLEDRDLEPVGKIPLLG